MSGWLNLALFAVYPYVALSVLLLGSLVRFDRDPYTWKSDSSQLLRRRRLKLGSNLFHYGILVVVLGHFAGFLMPDRAISWLISPEQHALLAMTVGGLAGAIAIVGLSILIHRRLADPRIRANSRASDIAVVFLLWAQLALGLLTVPVLGIRYRAAGSSRPRRLCAGNRHAASRCGRTHGRRAARLQAAYPSWLHDFSHLALHADDPYLERAGLVSRPRRLPDRACASADETPMSPFLRERDVAAEMQFHPAPSREAAWREAERALAVRRALLAEAARRGITAAEGEAGAVREAQRNRRSAA